jgi:adenylosuccinate synthase
VTEFPADLRTLAGAEPIYERMPGWAAPTKGVTRLEQLPAEARRYIERLEEISGVECAIISTGSDRAETIVRPGSVIEKWLGSWVAG